MVNDTALGLSNGKQEGVGTTDHPKSQAVPAIELGMAMWECEPRSVEHLLFLKEVRIQMFIHKLLIYNVSFFKKKLKWAE